MPNLEDCKDGVKYGGTGAIMRTLGAKHGYYPDDPMCAYVCDMLYDTYKCYFNPIHGPGLTMNAEQKEAHKTDYFCMIDKFMCCFEAHCKKKTCEFLCCDKLCICDFQLGAFYVDLMNNPNVGIYSRVEWDAVKAKYPCFCAFGDKFAAANKTYLDKRPVRPF